MIHSASQQIVHDYPPIYDQICEAFPWVRRNESVIFSYGPTIYVPSAEPIAACLLAHEAVHGARQGSTQSQIRDWWARYLSEPKFRLDEETPAHQAEFRWWREHGNRSERRRALRQVSERLSGPLYGSMISRRRAEYLLSTGSNWKESSGAT